MPRKRERPTPPGKRRTREHVVGDLAVNHLERHVLQCGHTVHRVYFDYGYDLAMFTYGENGEIEPGWAFFQVKGTDRLQVMRDGKTISWAISRRDLRLWLSEAYPVILVVYDGNRDRAYFLYLQRYFDRNLTKEVFAHGESLNVHIPLRARVSYSSIRRLAQYKRDVHRLLQPSEDPHEQA